MSTPPGWAGPDSDLADHLRECSRKCLKAYAANPLLVREHANIERATAQGGYGRKQVYELIQNGADELLGTTGKIHLILTNEYLYCANEGKAITKNGLDAILGSNLSAKRGWEIGRFGLGFKSVLGISSDLKFFSRSISFGFSKQFSSDQISPIVPGEEHYPVLRLAAPIDPGHESLADDTLASLSKWATSIIRLKLTEPNSYWLADDLREFPTEFLLFATHVTALILENRLAASKREVQIVEEDGTVVIQENELVRTFRVFSTKYRPSEKARQDAGELADREELPLHWAVPIEGRVGRGRFWAFFPTSNEITLSGILNAPWKTNADRHNLLESQINDELMAAAARLAIDSLPQLSRAVDNDPAWILDVLPGRMDESPGWWDRKLQDSIYKAARSSPSIPNQKGDLCVPRTLRLTPEGLPPVAYERWAAYAGKPDEWPHMSSETRTRRPRMVRLFSDGVRVARPSAIGEWLEALVSDGSREASAAGILLADWLLSEGRLEHLKDDILGASLIMTSTGTRVPIHSDSVFLPDKDGARSGLTEVDLDLTRYPGVRTALSQLGIKEADAVGRFRNYISSGPRSIKDWTKFWQLAEAAGDEAEDAILSLPELHLVHVKNCSGEFVPWRRSLMPGEIARPEEDPSATVDIHFHQNSLALLQAIGLREHPRKGGGSRHEIWFPRYEEQAFAIFNAEMTKKRNPDRSLIAFVQEVCIGPLEPLYCLGKAGNARFSEYVLSLPRDARWTYQHKNATSYPVITIDAPSLWVIKRKGMVQTSLGIESLENSVSSELGRWSRFLPVSISRQNTQDLELHTELAQLTPNQWERALKAAEQSQADSLLGAFYAAASLHVKAPPFIRCLKGLDPSCEAPENVIVVTSANQSRALEHGIEPYLYVETADEARLLVERWQLLAAASKVKTQQSHVASGEPFPLTDRFPGLRGALGQFEDSTIVPCSSISTETISSAGKDVAAERFTAEGSSAFILDEVEDAEALDLIGDWLRLALSPTDKAAVLNHGKEQIFQSRFKKIASIEPIEEKLISAVGGSEEKIRRRLPKDVTDAVEYELGRSLLPDDLAKLAIAVYGIDVFKELAPEMAELEPPGSWAGSSGARSFVRKLGLGIEFAGFESGRREPLLQVEGPPRLPSLHDYQRRMSDNVKELICGSSRTRGLLCLPTGAGKTRVAVQAITESICNNKVSSAVIWIAPSDELCEQAVQSWSECWRSFGDERLLSISRLWSTNRVQQVEDSPQIVIATIDKLYSCINEASYEWLQTSRCVVVDEAHGATTKEYTKVLEKLGIDFTSREIKQDRAALLGLTATPFRGTSEEETRRLVNRFGGYRLDSDTLGPDPYRTLQNRKVLAEVDHQLIDGVDLELTQSELDEASRLQRLPATVSERLSHNSERNRNIIEAIFGLEKKLGEGWTAILFAASVSHAQVLSSILNMNGIKAASISSQTSSGARRHYVEQFRNKEIRVLSNYGVLTQGFDAPAVSAVFVARPTLSPNVYQQMIGRGLRGRLNGGKDRCLIVNVKDNLERYGLELAFRHFEKLWTSNLQASSKG